MTTWTQTERDALASTIAKGILTVEYADHRVTYQSLEQMRALLAEMDASISQAAGTRIYRTYATFTRD